MSNGWRKRQLTQGEKGKGEKRGGEKSGGEKESPNNVNLAEEYVGRKKEKKNRNKKQCFQATYTRRSERENGQRK